MTTAEFVDENPPSPNISDDLFQLLTDSGDPRLQPSEAGPPLVVGNDGLVAMYLAADGSEVSRVKPEDVPPGFQPARAGEPVQVTRYSNEHSYGVWVHRFERASLDDPQGRWVAVEPEGFQEKGFVAYELGYEYGQRMRDVFAFDPQHGGYHSWDGSRWAVVQGKNPENRLYSEFQKLLADSTYNVRARREIGKSYSEIVRGLSDGVERGLPLRWSPIACLNGVVDIYQKPLEVRPFDRETDTHRATLGGNYQAEWTDEYCRSLIRTRYTKSVGQLTTDDGVETIWRMFGLAISERGQALRGLFFIVGPSGSGKGGTLQLYSAAGGERVIGTSQKILLNRSGEIDSLQTNITLKGAVMVVIGEAERADTDRLNDITGEAVVSSRLPWGGLVSGVNKYILVVTTVNPPELDTSTGIARRLAVVRMQNGVDPDGRGGMKPDEKGDPTQDEVDALVTLGVREAAQAHQQGYEAPTGDLESKKQFRRDADPLGEWLAERHAEGGLHGKAAIRLAGEFDPTVQGRYASGLARKLVHRAKSQLGYEAERGRYAAGTEVVDVSFLIRGDLTEVTTKQMLNEFARQELSQRGTLGPDDSGPTTSVVMPKAPEETTAE